MKNQTSRYGSAISVLAVLIGVSVSIVGAVEKSQSKPLTLSVASERDSYTLGEIVNLNFDLANPREESVSLLHRPTVTTGYLHLWIARDGGDFGEYRNTSWGLLDGSGIVLKPGESFKSQAAVFWNSKPAVSHLNESAAKRVMKDRVLTDYAFPVPGVYSIRAGATIPDTNSPDSFVKIESRPIQISVVEPSGDDLEVWNRIKNNGDIGYFLQQGDAPRVSREKTDKLLDELSHTANDFPQSRLATKIKLGLEAFRLNEQKRRDRLQRGTEKSKS